MQCLRSRCWHATVATHHPDITSARLKSDLHEQKPRTKRRRNAVLNNYSKHLQIRLLVNQRFSEIPFSDSLRGGPDEHRNVVPQNLFDTSVRRSANQKQGASSYNIDTNLHRTKNQYYSHLIDPEDEENCGNYAISNGKQLSLPARQSETGKKDIDDFKLRNSKVNFYDSKVQLGDISKVTLRGLRE